MTAEVAKGREWIRVPRDNHTAVFHPAHAHVASVLAQNVELFRSSKTPAWIRELRYQVRASAFESSRRYLAEYTNSLFHGFHGSGDHSDYGVHASEPNSLQYDLEAPWIIGGHQPELFHPGVWFKNFVIDSIARESAGIGLHTIIDHDLARAASIRVPKWDAANGRLFQTGCELPLCRSDAGRLVNQTPWHSVRIDRAGLRGTLREITDGLSSLGVQNPIAVEFWSQLEQMPAGKDAAIAFSQLRHSLEIKHGLRNLELPFSRLASSAPWQAFLHHCVVHGETLHEVYNASLQEYRVREKITNPTQPVPRLSSRDGWFELPFWLYKSDSNMRQRLWGQPDPSGGDRWHLGSGPNPSMFDWVIDWSTDPKLSKKDWEGYVQDGICIRPRALLTTMFLRCFMADLFVHGIGGGVYDRLTDAIIHRFLRMPAPHYLTCTATEWLTMNAMPELDAKVLLGKRDATKRQAQLLRSRPELFLDPNDARDVDLQSHHASLISTIPPRGSKKRWHLEITNVKEKILERVAGIRKENEEQLHRLEQRVHELRYLNSREYSFVLFPESTLMPSLRRMSR